MSTKETSISIPLTMHRSASARAKELDCSLSGYIRSLIRADLNNSRVKQRTSPGKLALQRHAEAKANPYNDVT